MNLQLPFSVYFLCFEKSRLGFRKQATILKLTSLLRIFMTRSFKPFLFLPSQGSKPEFEEVENLGLYVHIPFCSSLCGFCPYCKVLYNRELAARYKEALLKEITLAASPLQMKKQVTSLYFGGGTPVLLISALKEIIDHIKTYFLISEGIGVELHPNDVTAGNLKLLQEAGVDRISIGIQSFHMNCLKALGRGNVVPSSLIEKLDLAASFGFSVIDVDLIFAIPTQSSKDLLEDIQTAFAHGATQVSTYPFIDFTFADNKNKPLSETQKKKMLKDITAYVGKHGIIRTSVWTFAKPGTKKYTSVTRDFFLGFGASAASLLRSEFRINTFSVEEYIRTVSSSRLPTSLALSFSPRQRACYYLFWSCYMLEIDPHKFERDLGISLKKTFPIELFLGRRLGLLRRDKGVYHLTERGAYYYHYVEQAYTTAYIDKMWSVSRKKSFPDKIELY